MARKFDVDDDWEMMNCAAILLELPQLVYMSEFKDASKSSGPVWGSTKKRSDFDTCRKPRRIAGFKCFRTGRWSSSLMAHFGGGASRNSVDIIGGGVLVVAGKKRKKTANPYSDRTTTSQMEIKKQRTTLLRVKSKAGRHPRTVLTEKKRKNPDMMTTPTSMEFKKQKTCLKLRFKLSSCGNGMTTCVVADKNKDSSSLSSGSGVSNEFNLPETAAASSSVVVYNNNPYTDPQLSSVMKKEMPLLPDLNIPIMMDFEDPNVADVPMQTSCLGQGR